MKQLKRVLLVLLLVLALALVLTACGNNPTPGPDNGEDGSGSGGGNGGETTEYTITWVVRTTDGYARQYTTTVKAGETPVPPTLEPISTSGNIWTVTGWDKTLAAATEDTTYTAVLSAEVRTVTVTFMVGDETISTANVAYGTAFSALTLPTREGKTFFALQIPSATVNSDLTVKGAFTTLNGAQLAYALETKLIAYSGSGDNGNAVMKSATALEYLLLSERNDGKIDVIHQRILDHLENLVKGGNEPYFDLEPYWNYPITAADIMLAKETPSVWNDLSAATKERLEFVMKCFAVICALGTDDYNNYSTGPALMGNFGKNWNPNYRLANVPQIIFCKTFFGGTAQVNDVLKSFKFDEYMAKFEEYGFTRAKTRWTVTAPEDSSINFTHPRVFMEGIKNGDGTWQVINAYKGKRYDASGRLSTDGGEAAGSGRGVVAAGERGYTYNNFTLDRIGEIWTSLLMHNYSGGAVISQYGEFPLGTTDANGSKYKAYIYDKTSSIVEGRLGMMLEFKSGDGGNGKDGSDIRSSTSYCSHDFIMIVACTMAMDETEIFNLRDFKHTNFFRLMWVGNTDLIYKMTHGYISYSLGTQHSLTIDTDEKPYTNDGYSIVKAYWLDNYGSAFKPEDIPKAEVSDTTSSLSGAGSGVSNDLTHSSNNASQVVGNKNWWDNDFFLEFTLRLDDETIPGKLFGVRLRSSVRTDSGNRADLFNVNADGSITLGVNSNSTPILTPVGDSPTTIIPDNSEYGWHRYSFRYHQGVNVDDTNKSVSYVVTLTVMIDGKEYGTYAGMEAEFIDRGWLLYSATYDENAEGHVVYSKGTPQPGGNNKWKEGDNNRPYWQFYRSKFYNQANSRWFLEYKDFLAYCGSDWYMNVATVNYVLNGGTFEQSDTLTPAENTLSYTACGACYFYEIEGTLTVPTPTREGYTFTGWYDNADCNGEPLDSFDLSTGEAITLYAGWAPNTAE